ncbi:hypothetical protein PORY_001971 [Pneumocystis oryctolagi]|uniref:Uncharacterized protein n=1 Tax=Pneumocystis oryctolagi TaxID=42067 RepID=A0ACB7CCA8_9ASCO|nr:hypothetical protein PORY_001971 [Pneumocystis oryctolagi]
MVATKTVQVPQMAESITEGMLKQWNKKIGDFVKQDEEIATIETDKIDVSVNAPASGILKEVFKQEEDIIQTGQNLCVIELTSDPSKHSVDSEPVENIKNTKIIHDSKESQSKENILFSNIESKNNTSKEEKHEVEDVKFVPISEEQEINSSNIFRTSQNNRQEHTVKMNRMRMRIASRLKESQNTTAFLTTFNEVDMSSIIEMRSLYKDEILKETGVKLGFMSAFIKASVKALKKIPVINASIIGPDGGDTIVYRDYVDISVAVATSKGLVTPVIRNAEALSFIEIEKTITELSSKIIIFLIRILRYLALTYDHRLVDGRESVTFLRLIKEYVEDPRKLLL